MPKFSKKLRFEILERDSFRCQFCGAGPPDAVLNLSRLTPPSAGGDCSPENLITACADCVAGKGARTPGNFPEALHKRTQAKLNAERRQMAELADRYQKMEAIEAEKLEAARKLFCEGAKCELNPAGESALRKILKKFPYELVLSSVQASLDQYLEPLEDDSGDFTEISKGKAFHMIGRICACEQKMQNRPWLRHVNYAKAILRNRFTWQARTVGMLGCHMEHLIRHGADPEEIKRLCAEAPSYAWLQNTFTQLERFLAREVREKA